LDSDRSGLREAGPRIPDAAVELAYVAPTVLRQGIFMFIVLRQDIDAAAASARDAGGRGASAEEVIERFVVGNERMLARLATFGERAPGLLRS
jgi:hypothetical protein